MHLKKKFFNNIMQVTKEDMGLLLNDAVKQGKKKTKIDGKVGKENAEEVDNPTPATKPNKAVKKPSQAQVSTE